jgi:two-component system cell cycle response regulator
MMEAKPKILIVDDRIENLIALEETLEELDVEFVRALSGNEAVAETLRNEFALVLMDVQMPDMDGFETSELIYKDKKNENVPIVFISAIYSDEYYKIKGVNSGGIDFITKPVNDEVLLGKVQIFLKQYQQKAIIEKTNRELIEANKKILEQQKALIEEERIKVMLKMSGATAHEFSQPLSALIGCIELLEEASDPDIFFKYLPTMKESGKRLVSTLNKMRNIKNVKVDGSVTEAKLVCLDQKVNILSIEDVDADFDVLNTVFKGSKKIMLKRAKNIQEAFHKLDKARFDMIFLDFSLPDGNGFDFLKMLETKAHKIPVVVITGHGDEVVASEILREGAYDYLPKSKICHEALTRIIANTLDKVRYKNELELTLKKMAKMSTLDELTGLYNRRFMNEFLEKEFARARRFSSGLSCMILDIDHFKQVNDTYGHACGDFILKAFAGLLEELARKSDFYFRYGGEEFVVLLPHVDLDGTINYAERVRSACENKKYTYEETDIDITVSIGISSLNQFPADQELDLIGFADKALYRAKTEGRNCVRVYAPES